MTELEINTLIYSRLSNNSRNVSDCYRAIIALGGQGVEILQVCEWVCENIIPISYRNTSVSLVCLHNAGLILREKVGKNWHYYIKEV